MLVIPTRSIGASLSGISTRSFASISQRPYTSSSIVLDNSNGDDSDYLDISSYGNYSLVLPDDPTREGVSHIIPGIVPPHIPRPSYARMVPLSTQGNHKSWAALAKYSESSHRPRLNRKIPRDAIERKLRSMEPAGNIARLALLAAENIIQARN
ncbi:hypothetical protein FRB93_012383 [Tulasnella sp. JGI-2019a]|nr:hypothetical protein FRB93_012383 [Tulasnella sp. JGI-2019a]